MMKALCVLSLCALCATVNANIYLNEVLGSTTSTDDEFVELYNSGPAAVDIGGWQVQLWDSDSGASFGGADGGSPYSIPAGTMLPAGGYYLMANTTFSSHYLAVPNQVIQENAIENSSYTIILKDAALASIDSIFVRDTGPTDAANDAGTLITPNGIAGPDGTNLPAGFYRVGDGNAELAFLEFSPQPAPSATPGAQNIPEPASLLLLGLAGLVLRRR